MVGTSNLVERIVASKYAQLEFDRVKKEKMQNAVSKTHISNKADISQRVRTNRASAAASRARIFCYARELEKCTDRLEEQRNNYRLKSEHRMNVIQEMQAQNEKLRSVLHKLWDKKDPDICRVLIDTEAMFLLSPTQKTFATENKGHNLPPTQPSISFYAHKPRSNIVPPNTSVPYPGSTKNSEELPTHLHYRFY